MTSAETQKPQTQDPHPMPSIASLLRMTFEQWIGDNIPRHAAALAFYTLFAIAPLLLLSVELMSLVYGRETAEAQLTAQVEQYVHNADAAALTQTILDNALPSSANWFVTAGILIALLYGASAVFGELQFMLNIIWGTYPEDGVGFRRVVWDRLLAIAMVILSGLLIVCGLVLTLWYAEATSSIAPNSELNQVAYFFLLFAITALVFALIYKYVPATHTAWHDVIIGAVSTAFLVSVARLVITLYLGYNRIGSVYGAAGSLVIILLWVYYSTQIFFLGAEFTHVYSRTYGARRRGEISGSRQSTTGCKRRSTTTNEKGVDSDRQPQRTGGQIVDGQPQPLVIKAGERVKSEVEIEIVNLDAETDETTKEQRKRDQARRNVSNAVERMRQGRGDARKEGGASANSTDASSAQSQRRRWWEWLWFWRSPSAMDSDQNESKGPTLPQPNTPTIPVHRNTDEEETNSDATQLVPSTAGPSRRSRMKQIVLLPLQVLRPFREIITAVSVIGALSVAVLFGFPWRRRRRNSNRTTETTDEIIDEITVANEPSTSDGERDRE